MGDPGQVITAIVILTITAVGSYAAVSLIQVLVKRLGGTSLPQDQLRTELDDLRARIEEGEQARDRIAELEERLEFAERLLAQQREAGKLAAGEHS